MKDRVLWRPDCTKRRARLTAAAVLTLLALTAACAINSGVVPAGGETYLVSRQAATGFTGLGKLKAEALREAEAFCRQRGKTMVVLSSDESEPPYIFGNFPRVEVKFACR